ncbi:hypothetical protein [Methylicorpusculum sp.]|uniref:hypothetical protein n=1 Tax=Methylicorpusculum sp. TaxID=2713644 RepID=UPI002ABA2063|nr:hypothetical protein [Methylicorpusculum sp.]MDZ4154210.1 hypothetical protein [Methylicorpusculum sp.]
MKTILLITLGSASIDAFFNNDSEIKLAVGLLIVMLTATAIAMVASLQLRKSKLSKDK